MIQSVIFSAVVIIANTLMLFFFVRLTNRQSASLITELFKLTDAVSRLIRQVEGFEKEVTERLEKHTTVLDSMKKQEYSRRLKNEIDKNEDIEEIPLDENYRIPLVDNIKIRFEGEKEIREIPIHQDTRSN